MDLRHWNEKYQVQRSKKQDMQCHDIFKYTLFNLCILLKSNFNPLFFILIIESIQDLVYFGIEAYEKIAINFACQV